MGSGRMRRRGSGRRTVDELEMRVIVHGSERRPGASLAGETRSWMPHRTVELLHTRLPTAK